MKKIISCVIIIITLLITFSTYSFGGFWANVTNLPGTMKVAICDTALGIIDGFQWAANGFATLSLKTYDDRLVCYKYSYLEDDGVEGDSKHTDAGAGHRNMFTMVKQGYQKNYRSPNQTEKAINIDIADDKSTDEKKYDFSSDTLIPVIVVDWYTISAGRIPSFDADFFSSDSNFGKYGRIVRMIIRIEIYIATIILISGLFWHAFNLIKGVINPNEKKSHIEGIQNFAKYTGLLILCVVVMSLGIYLNKLTFSMVSTSDEIELPIRVNVEEADYSFSTTKTGYYRYMASMQNPNLAEQKISYTKDYVRDVAVNLGLAIVCFVRKVFIVIVAIRGPIIVIRGILANDEKFVKENFLPWVKHYMGFALLQSLISFIYAMSAD